MSPNFDKEEMRSYLLGASTDDRRAALEESILCDPGVYEELLVIEEELIDQYVANKLSPSERQQFETHFLITAERQKNLRFGRLLKRYLTSQAVVVPAENIPAAVGQSSKSAPAKNWFPFASGVFARGAYLAASAAVVAGITTILLVCWLASRRHEPPHVAQQDSSRILYVSLAPGTLRSGAGGMPHVQRPANGVNVKLELQLSDPKFQKYRSELLRENEVVQSTNELKMETKGDQHVVPWTIAGDVLTPGDYQVRLSGVSDSGADELIDNYSFRVIK